MHPIKGLHNKHKGQDIYILCSGPSVDYFSRDFFNNKIVISVNRSYTALSIDICKYVIFQDYNEDLISDVYNAPGVLMIIPERAGGRDELKSFVEWEQFFFEREFPEHNPKQRYYFKHCENSVGTLPELLEWNNPNYLVINKNTTNSALHLAAQLGAKNIILVGHDGCLLDGQANHHDYWRRFNENDYRESYLEWMGGNLELTSKVRKKLIDVFNVNIYSLNPFLSFALDGHIPTYPPK